MKTLNLNFLLTIIFSLTVTLGFSSCEKEYPGHQGPGQSGPPSEGTETPGGASNTYCDGNDLYYVEGVSTITNTDLYTEGRVYLQKVMLYRVSGGHISRHEVYLTPGVAGDLDDQVQAEKWQKVDLIVTLQRNKPVTLYSTDEDYLEQYVYETEDTDQTDHSSMWGDEWSKGSRELTVISNVAPTSKAEEQCTDYIRDQFGS